MKPALNIMEEFPFLKDEAPPDGNGWLLMLKNYYCPYVLRDVIIQHGKFGFDVYIHNVENAIPISEFDDVWVKIYCRKKQPA